MGKGKNKKNELRIGRKLESYSKGSSSVNSRFNQTHWKETQDSIRYARRVLIGILLDKYTQKNSRPSLQ